MIICILERFLQKFHGEWIVSGRPIQKQLKKLVEDFHGGSGVQTPHSHCRGIYIYIFFFFQIVKVAIRFVTGEGPR